MSSSEDDNINNAPIAKKSRTAAAEVPGKRRTSARTAEPESVNISTDDFLSLQFRVLLYAQKEIGSQAAAAMEFPGNAKHHESLRATIAMCRAHMKEEIMRAKLALETALTPCPKFRMLNQSALAECDKIINEYTGEHLMWK